VTAPNLPTLADQLRAALARTLGDLISVHPRRDVGTVVVNLAPAEVERMVDVLAILDR